MPAGRDEPLWRTLRRPFRPLRYDAARAMFTRANAALGSNCSLHDLRHTAAYRMARDPQMPLTDVQWVMGHAHLSTTQRYLHELSVHRTGGGLDWLAGERPGIRYRVDCLKAAAGQEICASHPVRSHDSPTLRMRWR